MQEGHAAQSIQQVSLRTCMHYRILIQLLRLLHGTLAVFESLRWPIAPGFHWGEQILQCAATGYLWPIRPTSDDEHMQLCKLFRFSLSQTKAEGWKTGMGVATS